MQYYTRQSASGLVARGIESIAKSDEILVLLSGGSSAAVGVGALEMLPASIQQNITVMLADERYVPYNSTDSNAQLLRSMNVQKYCRQFIETLTPDNQPQQQVTARYANSLARFKANNVPTVALLGIGTDNHTAGILPNTIAAKSNEPYALYYETENFKRITITPPYFTNIKMAYVYAEGTDKLAAVNNISGQYDAINYPSQLVKKCQKYNVLYNKGEL